MAIIVLEYLSTTMGGRWAAMKAAADKWAAAQASSARDSG